MADATATLALSLDRADGLPMQVQLYRQVRELILSGRLTAGVRLPATRALAAELGVSRTTVLAAYDQLAAEGYLENRRGAGAFVPDQLPDPAPPETPAAAHGGAPVRLSARGAALAAPRAPRGGGRPFDPGAADPAGFPVDAWARELARAWRRPDREMLGPSPGGYPPLRAAIAAHLRAVRGLPVTADQVIVAAGLGETLSLLARASRRCRWTNRASMWRRAGRGRPTHGWRW